MSKKDKKAQTSTVTDSSAEVDNKTVAQTKPVKTDKPKKAVKKVKKPNIFVRFGKKTKEIFSELKKVTWPTFPTVLKQTGVVIAVVLFFLVLIFAFDSILSFFYKLLIK